jgi:hypothetical protein
MRKMGSKRLMVILLVGAIIISVIVGIWIKKPISSVELLDKKSLEFERLYKEKLYQGYDLSEADEYAVKAKSAYNKGDYENATKILDEAFLASEKSKKAIPVKIPSLWPTERYTEFYIQNFINPVLPPLTKAEMQSVVKEADTKKLTDFKGYYIKTREKITSSELPAEDKKRALEIINTISNLIDMLKRDIDTCQDITVIYADYNELRSVVIKAAIFVQEMRGEKNLVYDAFISTYKARGNNEMVFGATPNMPGKAYDISPYSTDDLKREIVLIGEAGCDFVRIDICYDYWIDAERILSEGKIVYKEDAEQIQKLEEAVKEIRKQNMTLFLVPFGVCSWMSPKIGGHGPAPFDLWKKIYIKQVKEMMAQCEPEYIGILWEAPGLVGGREIERDVSTGEWIAMIEELSKWIRTNYPDTVIVTGIAAEKEQTDFYRELMPLDLVDIYGINPYGLDQLIWFDENLDYTNGKMYWITETWDEWRGHYMDDLSDKYLIASIYQAQRRGMTGYILFYASNLRTKDFEETPAFYTYKRVMEEVRKQSISKNRLTC